MFFARPVPAGSHRLRARHAGHQAPSGSGPLSRQSGRVFVSVDAKAGTLQWKLSMRSSDIARVTLEPVRGAARGD